MPGPSGECPLEPAPSYGCEAVLAGARMLKRLAVLVLAVSVTAGAILIAYYARSRQGELLAAGMIILALAPIDAIILGGLAGTARLRAVRTVEAILGELRPSVYSLQSRLGMIGVAAQLPGGELAVIVVDSGNRAYGALLQGYTVTGKRGTLPRPPPLHAIVGVRGAASLALRASASAAKNLSRGGCGVAVSSVEPGARLWLPSPTSVEAVEVMVESGLVAMVSCPVRNPEQAARLAARALVKGIAPGAP